MFHRFTGKYKIKGSIRKFKMLSICYSEIDPMRFFLCIVNRSLGNIHRGQFHRRILLSDQAGERPPGAPYLQNFQIAEVGKESKGRLVPLKVQRVLKPINCRGMPLVIPFLYAAHFTDLSNE